MFYFILKRVSKADVIKPCKMVTGGTRIVKVERKHLHHKGNCAEGKLIKFFIFMMKLVEMNVYEKWPRLKDYGILRNIELHLY